MSSINERPVSHSETAERISPAELQPGDVVELHYGGDPWLVTVHSIHRYPSGALSIRYRPTSNPRAVDWSGFIEHDERIRLRSRGVAAVDLHTRSLLPA